MKAYYVYILTNWNNRVLYTGVTNDIVRRVYEHGESINDGFTKKYNVYKLVYLEQFSSAEEAIAREKQIKGYRREKKLRLVDMENPGWNNLVDKVQ